MTKKKVTAYECGRFYVTFKPVEEGHEPLSTHYLFMDWDTVKFLDRMWLLIKGPVVEHYLDWDTVASFEIHNITEWIFEDPVALPEPLEGEELTIVRRS